MGATRTHDSPSLFSLCLRELDVARNYPVNRHWHRQTHRQALSTNYRVSPGYALFHDRHASSSRPGPPAPLTLMAFCLASLVPQNCIALHFSSLQSSGGSHLPPSDLARYSSGSRPGSQFRNALDVECAHFPRSETICFNSFTTRAIGLPPCAPADGRPLDSARPITDCHSFIPWHWILARAPREPNALDAYQYPLEAVLTHSDRP